MNGSAPSSSRTPPEEVDPKSAAPKPKPRKASRVIRWLFLFWAIASTTWMANSFRTRGVDPTLLIPSPNVSVRENVQSLEFVPSQPKERGVVFICGSGVEANAYAPLLRPIAEDGFRVVIIKLPFRFAFLESHKVGAVERVRKVIADHQDIRWVVAGHSLGAALACRVAQQNPSGLAALVLLGTTHPKEDDLSHLTIPVTKVYAGQDGVAPKRKVEANKSLLPTQTKWIFIEGGNHSQFGNYGHQLMDGEPTISREEQQSIARTAILDRLVSRP